MKCGATPDVIPNVPGVLITQKGAGAPFIPFTACCDYFLTCLVAKPLFSLRQYTSQVISAQTT